MMNELRMSTEKHCIPLSIIKDIKCAQCDKFVTCGPVTVVPNDNVLCGRCYLWAKPEYRNYAFEALAQIFWFPCSNWEKKCPRKLEWNQSLEHEDHCAYEHCCSRFWRRGLCCSGRREIPIGDIRHTPVPPQLLDLIKCDKCLGFINCEPIFILKDGSNVCHRCCAANGVPPDSRRNIAYEQLSRILVFPCIFRNKGCPTRLKFGRDLWEHESKCPYNTSLRRLSQANKKSGQKERGVIETHSGHFYGTLTPNSLLFAPPTANKEFDVNKDIVKSLKKYQERRIAKADQLQSQMSEAYSADSNYEDDSRSITPPRDEDDLRQRMQYWHNQDRNLVENRDSGYQTGSRPRIDNIPQNMMPKVHDGYNNSNRFSLSQKSMPKPDYDIDYSRTPSRTSQNTSESVHTPVPYVYSGNKYDYERDNSMISYNSSRASVNGSENNILRGHFPEVTIKEIDPLAYNPSYRAVNRTESTRSNQELIKELKVKLKKSNSMRNDAESPYVKCKNLEDVLVVHDKIAT